MAAALQLTDRAYRYRANAAMPAGEKRCALCGNPGRVEVGHVDGHEENTSPENLFYTCRPCNVLAGNAMRRAGAGRLTRQYNPTRYNPEGARTVGQWLTAVTSMKGENSAMSVHDAVAMIHATPASKRSEFARQIWAARRRSNPVEVVEMWNPADTAWGQFGEIAGRYWRDAAGTDETPSDYQIEKKFKESTSGVDWKFYKIGERARAEKQFRAALLKAWRSTRPNPGFLPKSLFDRYTIRDKTEGADLQTNIQTLAGAKHAVKKFGRKHPCSALAIVSDKFGEVESYKPANGRELVIDRDNSKDYKRRATEEAKKNVRYELYIGGVLHDTYDIRKEAESFARDKRVTDGKNTRIKEVSSNPTPGERTAELHRMAVDASRILPGTTSAVRAWEYISQAQADDKWAGEPMPHAFAAQYRTAVKNPSCRNPYRIQPAGRKWEVSVLNPRGGWDVHATVHTRAEAEKIMEQLRDASPESQGGVRKVIPGYRGNPLTKYRVTYRGKTFEILSSSKAAAERQVRAVWNGEAVVKNPKRDIKAEKKQADAAYLETYPGSSLPEDLAVWAEEARSNTAEYRKRRKIYMNALRSYSKVAHNLLSYRYYSRRNPDDDATTAEALYESFHGVPPTQETIYEEVYEVPDAFAELGQLIELKVATIHGKDITIAAPDPENGDLSQVVKLASTPDGRQLYFIGGDQALDLNAMGFTESEERHRMLIGVLYELTYRTKKAFHKLKTTDYYHQLGEDTKNQPMLVYNPYSERMGVVGGDYHVRPEGIVN